MSAKYEVNSADNAEARPQKIETQLLLHVENCKWNEHHQRDRFLKNLELRKRQYSESNSIGWNLKEIFEQRDSPAHYCRDVPFAVVQRSQMSVPRERHEDVRKNEQADCTQRYWQWSGSELFEMMIHDGRPRPSAFISFRDAGCWRGANR